MQFIRDLYYPVYLRKIITNVLMHTMDILKRRGEKAARTDRHPVLRLYACIPTGNNSDATTHGKD